MNNKPTVFAVDADDVTRESVTSLVQTMNLRCRTYSSGRDFLESFDSSQAGCLVMEIRIPDVNGVQIQERLAMEGSTLPIIFLTNQATVSIAVRAMRNGAMHVIEKPFREHELWDVIQEAIELNEIRRETQRQQRNLQDRMALLNAKEQVLLEMIALGKAKEAIASEMGVCVRTVELRRNQLMKKLKMQTPIELVQFALSASNGHSRELQGAYCR